MSGRNHTPAPVGKKTTPPLAGFRADGIMATYSFPAFRKACAIMFRNLARLTLLFAAFVLASSVTAQKPSYGVPDRERERKSLAVNIVKAISAAEANYKKNHGMYATWDTLLSTGDFSDRGTKWASESFPTVAHAMYGPGPEIVPGWKLRLTLSKDGNAYDLLLEDVTDPKCSFAVFTDDRGRIRQGQAIECEQ